jgi:hypothetical protein
MTWSFISRRRIVAAFFSAGPGRHFQAAAQVMQHSRGGCDGASFSPAASSLIHRICRL